MHVALTHIYSSLQSIKWASAGTEGQDDDEDDENKDDEEDDDEPRMIPRCRCLPLPSGITLRSDIDALLSSSMAKIFGQFVDRRNVSSRSRVY